MSDHKIIRVEVFGQPVPQGSKQSGVAMRFDKTLGKKVPVIKDGKPVVFTREDDGGRLKPWRTSVAQRVREQYGGPVLDGPVRVDLTFYVVRPAAHYGSGKNANVLKDSAPLYVEKSPDLDKLTRGVMDALKGSLYQDDKFFWAGRIQKVWVPRDQSPGVLIEARVPQLRTVGDKRAALEAERQGTLLDAPAQPQGEQGALPVAA